MPVFIRECRSDLMIGNINLSNSDQRDHLEERLKSLDSRLRKSDRDRNSADKKSDNVNFSNAIRLSTEFVVAILVGVGIGWTIDRFFGTAPWAMIIFLPMGFIAGVRNIMRAAGLKTGSQVGNEDIKGDNTDRK